MKLDLFQVDSFTSKVFKGNPAAVCPLPHWVEDSVLQSIALENNLSETAFFVRKGEEYEIKWFTPTSEVDLCGHATLASGYVLMELLESGRTKVNFHSKSGPLSVSKKNSRFTLDFPSRPGTSVDCPPALLQALGVKPIETYLARDYMVVLESLDQVRNLSPDFQLLGEVESDGVLITAPGKDCDFVSRCFFPRLGINEDPVTGSAHCTLAPYWGLKLGKESLYCKQISLREGELWCDLRGDRIDISGDCKLYLKGQIEL